MLLGRSTTVPHSRSSALQTLTPFLLLGCFWGCVLEKADDDDTVVTDDDTSSQDDDASDDDVADDDASDDDVADDDTGPVDADGDGDGWGNDVPAAGVAAGTVSVTVF